MKLALVLAVLKPLPLKPLLALTQVTPLPLDQFEKVMPVGGVVHVAVGTAGQVTVVTPPLTVTTVCPLTLYIRKRVAKTTSRRKF